LAPACTPPRSQSWYVLLASLRSLVISHSFRPCLDLDHVPSMVQKMVIQSKSVEYMPLSLSLASLVNGICWTTYALIKFDVYITVSKLLLFHQYNTV
jgi:hypothetical protein